MSDSLEIATESACPQGYVYAGVVLVSGERKDVAVKVPKCPVMPDKVPRWFKEEFQQLQHAGVRARLPGVKKIVPEHFFPKILPGREQMQGLAKKNAPLHKEKVSSWTFVFKKQKRQKNPKNKNQNFLRAARAR